MIGVILSGGENRRMPVLKGFLTVEGTMIIERSLNILRDLFEKVIISTNMPEKYFRFDVPLIGDIRKDSGPMTGILSVLCATDEDSVFVVACDMPFLNKELIKYMSDKYDMCSNEFRASENGLKKYDAVIPVFKGKIEPLLGIYNKNVMRPMETAISKGEKSIYGMLELLNVLYISEDEVRRIDPDGRSFVNINTVADYEKTGGKLCLA